MRQFVIVSAAAAALSLLAMTVPADATPRAAVVTKGQAVQLDLSAHRRHYRHYHRRYYRGYYRPYYYPYRRYYYGPRYYYAPAYYYYPYGYYPYWRRPAFYFGFGW